MKRLTTLFIAGFASITLLGQVNYQGITNNTVNGDFDNDGFIDDIAGINTISQTPVLHLWNYTNGGYSEELAKFDIPENLISAKALNGKVVSGDFDNDGFIDDIASIFEVGFNQTSVTVWINNNGIFTPQQWWYGPDFDANQVASSMVSGDFDNDGFHDDIAAFYDYADEKNTKVFVWKSTGEKFPWPGTWWIGTDFNTAQVKNRLVAGDFDHDGYVDDIAALYDYYDNYCKAFVFEGTQRKFSWPTVWFEEEDLSIEKADNKILVGDFNNNGFMDNIATIIKHENATEIDIWETNKKQFISPQTWWYGDNQAEITEGRLTVSDIDNDGKLNEIAGLAIASGTTSIISWKAENKSLTLPITQWGNTVLSNNGCDNNGSCLTENTTNGISVYPNPSRGRFNIQLTNAYDEYQVALINSLGQKVYSQTGSGNTINFDLNNLNAGLYWVEVSAKGKLFREQCVIE
jgi:hypothetical protein